MDLAGQIEALVQVISKLGAGGGVLAGLWIAWVVTKEVRKWKNGPNERSWDHNREILEQLRKVHEGQVQLIDLSREQGGHASKMMLDVSRTQERIASMLETHGEVEVAAMEKIRDVLHAQQAETLKRMAELQVDINRRPGNGAY